MTTAIALACVCLGVALLVSPYVLGRIRHWWTERQADPRRHESDFWLWERDKPREVDHE